MKRIFAILLLTLAVVSCTTVEPGHKGVKISWGGETDMTKVYPEGMDAGISWIWNSMEEYDCREQTMTLSGEFLDYDGLGTHVEVILYYAPDPSTVNQLHQKIGPEYKSRLKGIFKSGVKTIVAQHQALKLNREERDVAEKKMGDILDEKLHSMYQIFKRVEITDVDLPDKISNMIVAAKEQDEKNNLAEKKELEQKYLADAQIARAKGEFEAAQYDAKTKDILSQPKMLQLLKVENEKLMWEGFIKHGKSPYGENNMFGINSGVGVFKTQQ